MTDVHSLFVIIVSNLKTLQPAGEWIKKQIINDKGWPGEAKSLVDVGHHVGIPLQTNKTLGRWREGALRKEEKEIRRTNANWQNSKNRARETAENGNSIFK